jgi:hypothetical protein
MATENRGVMVYLPSELEAKIAEYCTEYNITRKDKQGNTVTSLGSGIVAYLKSQLLSDLPRTVSDRPINGLTRAEVLDLIAESITSNTPIVGEASLAENLAPDPLDPAVVDRLEIVEQKLSSSMGVGRDEVEQLIQASEQRIMDAVRSLWGELAEIKTIDDRVNTPPIETSTTSQDKAVEDTVQLSMSRDITRWFRHLENEKFKGIVQTGISDEHSNQEIVTKLFAVGYGKKENTEPYTANLASAMKTALKIQDKRS